MALEISVYSSEEFEQMISNLDYRISKALIETILKNLNGKKRHYHVLSVSIENEQLIYDITVDKQDFPKLLENNIQVFENCEDYETCDKIVKALKHLTLSPSSKRGRPRKTLDV